MIKISNICLHQNSIFIIFFKILKIHDIFCENPRIIFVLFYDVHKENMITINLEDGREAPSKASLNKNNYIFFVDTAVMTCLLDCGQLIDSGFMNFILNFKWYLIYKVACLIHNAHFN